MSKLSGFRYREIVKKLRHAGFEETGRQRVATKSGITKRQNAIQLFQTMQEICLKEH